MPPLAFSSSLISGSTGNVCAARSALSSHPCSTMPSSTKFHRSCERSGFFAGSHRDGDWMTPASIAPSDTVSCPASLLK
jgi:hypothetical protein